MRVAAQAGQYPSSRRQASDRGKAERLGTRVAAHPEQCPSARRVSVELRNCTVVAAVRPLGACQRTPQSQPQLAQRAVFSRRVTM
mmetsp:Transcript_58265/g.134546  ORF Transcript_58265/g.134546 Transcript_58265/m.134546 type:complete len:85 (+) Transcript_58265:1164-1418(+)